MKEKIKLSSDDRKLRELPASRPPVKKILKEILQAETK